MFLFILNSLFSLFGLSIILFKYKMVYTLCSKNESNSTLLMLFLTLMLYCYSFCFKGLLMLLSIISLALISINNKYTLTTCFEQFDKLTPLNYITKGIKHFSNSLFRITKPLMDFYETQTQRLINYLIPSDSIIWSIVDMANVFSETQKGNIVVGDVVMNEEDYNKMLEKMLDETPILTDKQMEAYLIKNDDKKDLVDNSDNEEESFVKNGDDNNDDKEGFVKDGDDKEGFVKDGDDKEGFVKNDNKKAFVENGDDKEGLINNIQHKQTDLTNEEIMQFLFKDKNLTLESRKQSCSEDGVIVSDNEESKKDV